MKSPSHPRGPETGSTFPWQCQHCYYLLNACVPNLFSLTAAYKKVEHNTIRRNLKSNDIMTQPQQTSPKQEQTSAVNTPTSMVCDPSLEPPTTLLKALTKETHLGQGGGSLAPPPRESPSPSSGFWSPGQSFWEQEGLCGEKSASGLTRTRTATSGQLLRMAEAQQHLAKRPGPRRAREAPRQERLGLERPPGGDAGKELRGPTAAQLDVRQEERFKRQTAGSPLPKPSGDRTTRTLGAPCPHFSPLYQIKYLA